VFSALISFLEIRAISDFNWLAKVLMQTFSEYEDLM